jgi:hypothetical protein
VRAPAQRIEVSNAEERSFEFPFSSIVSPWQKQLQYPGDVRRCPDVYVGTIDKLSTESAEGCGILRFAAGERSTTRPDAPCLLLVMESPHVDEFDASKGDYVPWPANGKTGQAIQKRTPKLAVDLGLPSEAGLILLNAIPFQCSLGSQDTPASGSKPSVNWRKRRDEVFRQVWNSGGRELFLDRLRSWHCRGDTLVNACTRGRSGKPLRDLVEEAIRTHPCLSTG